MKKIFIICFSSFFVLYKMMLSAGAKNEHLMTVAEIEKSLGH